jgi:hypothetical protein
MGGSDDFPADPRKRAERAPDRLGPSGRPKLPARGRSSDRRIYCPLTVAPIDETWKRSSRRRTCRQSSWSTDTCRIDGASGVGGGAMRTGCAGPSAHGDIWSNVCHLGVSGSRNCPDLGFPPTGRHASDRASAHRLCCALDSLTVAVRARIQALSFGSRWATSRRRQGRAKFESACGRKPAAERSRRRRPRARSERGETKWAPRERS